MFKKLTALVLVLVMVVGLFPSAQAAPKATVDPGDVTIEGSNGFGSLLSQEINENQSAEAPGEYPDGYSVSNLEIEDGVATATYDSMEDATLVVTLYTEDGMQMLTSATTTVGPDDTEATVVFEGEIPQYFQASAYLLDSYDLSPLCVDYDTPMYTQEMQELMASTIHDYDPEKVLQLDNDETTNFAVYSDSTIIIQPAEGINTVTLADDENSLYIIENADEQVTSLAVGDIFTYTYAENSVMIVKITEIAVSGTTVSITGGEMDLAEAFFHIKIESSDNTQNMVVEEGSCGDGVTDLGFVNPQAVGGVETQKKGSVSESYSRGFGLEKEFGSVTVSGSADLSVEFELEYCVTARKQHVRFEITHSVNCDLTVSASIDHKFKLCKAAFAPIRGVALTIQPTLTLGFSGEVSFSVSHAASYGFKFDRRTGFKKISTKPSVEQSLEISGVFSVTLDLQPAVEIASGAVAEFGIETPMGVKLVVTDAGHKGLPQDNTASQRHSCEHCLSIGLYTTFECSLVMNLLCDSIKLKYTPLSAERHLLDFYISLDGGGAGVGECPALEYRVTIATQLPNGKPAQFIPVEITFLGSFDEDLKITTDSKGIATLYLPKRSIGAYAYIDGKPAKFYDEIKKSCKILLNPANPDSIMNSIAGNVKDDNIIAKGTLEGIGWVLFITGELVIKGYGAIPDHVNVVDSWLNYRDLITSLTIADTITQVGRDAFYDCNELIKVTLPVDCQIANNAFYSANYIQELRYTPGNTGVMVDYHNGSSSVPLYWSYSLQCYSRDSIRKVTFEEGVTHIGNYALYGGTALTEVELPDTLTSIGSYAFGNSKVLTELEFPGDAHAIDSKAFQNDTLTVYYPEANETWTEEVRQNYGGTITWVGRTTEEPTVRHSTPMNLRMSQRTRMAKPQGPDGNVNAVYPGEYGSELLDGRILKTASFTGLVPGQEYVVLALVDIKAENLVAPENLLFIEQAAALEDGTLVFQYFQRTDCNVSYVMACGASHKNLKDAAVIFPEMTADGSIQVLDPEVRYDGIVLTEGVDYIILGQVDFTEPGRYTCSIRGIHNYTGLVEFGYTVVSGAAVVATGWSGATEWTLTEDGVLTIFGSGKMKNYGYNGGQPWLNKGVDTTAVVIEDGVTSIGSGAFRNLTSLKTVTFPANTLTEMGEAAFYGSSLTSVEIPASLWTIKPYTFKNCANLTAVTFNEGNLQKIRDGAFYGTGLTELVLPDCLDILDVYAFKGCADLTDITIGSGLTELREAVFYGTAIPTITIPEGITKIGPYAFKNCVKLQTIDLPQSLTSVGEARFYACTGLKEIILPDAVKTIGNYAFRKCAAIEELSFGEELETIGECAFYGCTGLTELVIPDRVTTIKPYAFKTCTGLTSVTLGKSVKTIGEGAFNTCTGLKTIVFPASVTSIGDYCFSGSTNLWKLTFEGNAPAIGTGAFKGLNAYAYYPAGNSTYTSDVRQNYGGKLTWTAK